MKKEAYNSMDTFKRDIISKALNIALKKAGFEDKAFAGECLDMMKNKMVDSELFGLQLSKYKDQWDPSIGNVPMLMYYGDTKDFYVKYMDSIEDYLDDLSKEFEEEIKLEYPRYNSASWFVFKLVSSGVNENYREALYDQLLKRLDDFLVDNVEELEAVINHKDFSDLLSTAEELELTDELLYKALSLNDEEFSKRPDIILKPNTSPLILDMLVGRNINIKTDVDPERTVKSILLSEKKNKKGIGI